MGTTIDTKPVSKTALIGIRKSRFPGMWQVCSKEPSTGVISEIVTLRTKIAAQAFVMGMKFAEDGHTLILNGGHWFAAEVQP